MCEKTATSHGSGVKLADSLRNRLDPNDTGDTKEAAFVYDKPSKHLFRLFQLTQSETRHRGNETSLRGRLMSFTFDQGDGEYMQTFTAAVQEDRESVLKSLSGYKKYIALSYFCGSATDRLPLYLENVRCKTDEDAPGETNLEIIESGCIWITTSLGTFLLDMQRQQGRRFMWIDAICINQDSAEDKGSQPPRMNDIYANAETVYVWLGMATPNEAMALKMMPNVTTKLRSHQGRTHESLTSFLDRTGLPEPGHEIWKAYASIWTRNWWSRLWTFQEVAMATTAKGAIEYERFYKAPYAFVCCGETKTAWEQFDFFSEALADVGLLSWLVTGQEEVTWDHLHGLDAIAEVRTGRESLLRYGWSCSLSALLVATRRRDATEPADMVWGMYALIDKPTRKTLALDPEMPAEESFTRFAKHYIRHEVKECLLNHTATVERMHGLPSWRPNFASHEETTSIGSRWYGHYQEQAWLKRQMPCAGFQKKGKWALPRSKAYYAKYITNSLQGKYSLSGLYATNNPRQIALVPESNAILVSGIYLDTIAEIVPCNDAAESVFFLSYNSVQQTSHWDQACFSLAQRTLSDDSLLATSKSKYDLYARTLTANRVVSRYRESLKPESTWAKAFREGLWSDSDSDEEDHETVIDRDQMIDFAAPYLALRNFMQATLNIGGTISSKDNLDRATQQFASCLQLMSRQRCFFATKGGRIGLGPSDARPGDQVVVMFYCPTPYLIRPTTGPQDTQASAQGEFVGEAYMNGFMYGEALAMFDEGKLHETKWKIK
ncbi:hypothetical protein M409DRAFT_66109 [Zasmidium cellare ATCC 36951]|uniref:Heterokaryon incompatibility domain-containing protein n=1 Tax=Zasmidium cellare ATCC 36951 TaxID=1080233 RepID=A0A6A6CIL6_ZASCE|nr:uncharacterized protein M409DRAFT_66109 [Zasmidium cellare ATCC 36951]KAF2166995.1 hypothetical protein M409DRAFT_66109 [Zasmidium cellare ATCC 36951]